MNSVRTFAFATCSLLISGAALAQPQEGLEWNIRTAEHLLNRAAFGGTTAEIENAVEEYVKLAYKYPNHELIPSVMSRLGDYFQAKGQQ